MNEKHQPGIIPHEELMSNSESVKNTERSALAMIEKKRRQISRMRWVVSIAWALFVAVLIAGSFIEASVGHGALVSTLAMTARSVFVISLFLTVAWYVRSVSLRFDIIQQGLAAIQDRLKHLP